MPKLKNRPPQYSQFKNYAVIYYNKKRIYLGIYGSDESWTAYNRFIAECRSNPVFVVQKGKSDEPSVTVKELAAAFLDQVKTTLDDGSYRHYRVIIFEFLLKLYGSDTAVDDFTPKCLKLIRSEMIQSKRFCRNTMAVEKSVAEDSEWQVRQSGERPDCQHG